MYSSQGFWYFAWSVPSLPLVWGSTWTKSSKVAFPSSNRMNPNKIVVECSSKKSILSWKQLKWLIEVGNLAEPFLTHYCRTNSSIFKSIFGSSNRILVVGIRSFCLRVVSPTVCSPTTKVDSPTSYMSVRLRFICWSFKSELLKVLVSCIIPCIISSILS